MAEIRPMDIKAVMKQQVIDPIFAHRDAIHTLMIISMYADRRSQIKEKIAEIDDDEPDYIDDVNTCKATYEKLNRFPWPRFLITFASCSITYLILTLLTDFYIESLIATGILSIILSFAYACYYWSSDSNKARDEWLEADNELDELHDERNALEAQLIEMESEICYKLIITAELAWLLDDYDALEWCIYALLHNEEYATYDLNQIIEAWKNVHNESST